ncbi:hypothetical protein CCACVL1_00480 [Corchorus capsularis]|uniref:Uncharacterized protein n=1 Tax=Corchorus capsularis TaxID=210143 RepID=A0A1R3KWM9_COCAP|nr:hypothetical protein CCACVL1_00480 [Corchorus capsularis]
MAQWESARLEAEARLVRESSKKTVPNPNPPLNLRRNQPINNIAADNRPRCLDVLKAWQGVVAGMFAFPSHDLESPTSTLSFPDSMARVPGQIGGLVPNCSRPNFENSSYANNNSWTTSFEKSDNQIQEVAKIMDSCNIELGEEYLTDSGDIGAWFEEPIANIMEGLSDALNFNSGVLNSSMGVEKSSESCWDSVLNLVNSSPYNSPSPVF